MASVPTAQAIAVVEQRVAYFLAVQIKNVIRLFPKSRLLQDVAELAHLAPEHAHRPMLNVEIMVLHVGNTVRAKPELALEGGAGVAP